MFSASSSRNQQGLAYAYGVFYVGYDLGGGRGEVLEYDRSGKMIKSSGALRIGHAAELSYRQADGFIYEANGGGSSPTYIDVIDMRLTHPRIVKRYNFTGLGNNGMVAIDNQQDRMIVFAGPTGGPYTVEYADFNGKLLSKFVVPDEGTPQGIELLDHRLVLLTSAERGMGNTVVIMTEDGGIVRKSTIDLAAESEGLAIDQPAGIVYLGSRTHHVYQLAWSALNHAPPAK